MGAGASLLVVGGVAHFGDRLKKVLSPNEIPSVPLPTFEATASEGGREKPQELELSQEEFLRLAEVLRKYLRRNIMENIFHSWLRQGIGINGLPLLCNLFQLR